MKDYHNMATEFLNRYRIWAAALALVFLSGSLSSCTTTAGSEKDDRAVLKKGIGKPVVLLSKSDKTVVARLDRHNWVEIRKKSSSDKLKLYSGLGVKEWEIAISDARAYLQKHPKDLDALIVLSTALAMSGNYNLAAYYAKMIKRYYPGYPETDNLLGLAVLHSANPTIRDYNKAAQYFHSAFTKNETSIASGLNLGELQLRIGNASNAESTFSEVRKRCDNCLESLLGEGAALGRLKKFDKARSVFLAALKKEPENPTARYRLALIEKNGYNDMRKAKDYLNDILADRTNNHLSVKRQANFLLRSIEAAELGHVIAKEQKEQEKNYDRSVVPIELYDASYEDE